MRVRLRRFGIDDHAQPVRDHDQKLVAARMAKTVVDRLEAVEIDEQHQRFGGFRSLAEQLVDFGSEMEPVGERGDGVVHPERMGALDRRPHFGEQAVDRGSDLGHGSSNRFRCGRHKIAFLDCEKAVAERREGTGALAVRPFGSDIADEEAESARDERCDDLLVELRQVEQRRQREDEGRNAGNARKNRVADLLSSPRLHLVRASPRRASPPYAFASNQSQLIKRQRGRSWRRKMM